MFRLAQLSLRNRAVVALVSLGLLVGGALSMTSLKQELIPSLDVPMALVTATNPGVTNELMEQQLATPLETAIESVPGVDSVQVTSVNSAVFAIAEFEYGTDMDLANQKLTTAISKIAARLPSGVETNVLTGSMDDMPILQFAVNGADGAATADVGHLVNDVLVPRLSRLANVRSVDVTGYAAERVTVTPRPADLARFGVTLSQFNDLLSDYGLSLPAGTVADGGLTLSVQAGNALASADDLAGLPLAQSPDGGVVRVEDVADVTQAPAAATSYSRLDGANAVSVSITKTPAGNTVEVSETVRDTLEEMAGVLADAGLEATVVFDQAPMIERSIDGLSEEGLLGLGFAVVVILLFLFSVRSTLVSAVSIPLSLLAAFVALKGTGETLNILTLGGLTIAIGRVVDDAIVVIENIKRHLSYGEAKHDAIVGAVKEVGGAVASSTICTVAVFVPLAFTGGMVGELFRPFGLTVALALVASLLVALTIVPVLAYWFVPTPVWVDAADRARQRADAEAKERRSIWQRAYLPTLRAALAHPVVTVLVAVVALGGTAALVPTLQTNFLGGMTQDSVTVTQTFAAGTSLAAQDAQAEQTEQRLQTIDGVTATLTQVGGSSLLGISLTAEPQVTYNLALADDDDFDAVKEAAREIATATAGAAVTGVEVGDPSTSMMGSTTVDLIVRATDLDALAEAAAQVEAVARRTEGAVDVTNNLAADQPTVQVTVDRDRARLLGLSETAVEGLLRGVMVPTEIGSLTTDAGEVSVYLDLGLAATDLDQLGALPLVTTPAGTVTLADVATIETTQTPVSLTRVDGERSATISVTPESEDLGQLSSALTDAVDELTLPTGVTVEVGGVAAQMDEAFSDLGIALLIAVIIVFIVMVATFGSLLQPFILLISIPFAATGALLALVLTDTALGVPALIGCLMLVGIVVANAIVLIDLINQYRRRGDRTLDEAITEGARQRLRPILMTAAATVFALVPMALGLTGGGGSFLSQPLALVVIGGLISSTLLTLVVVPVLYRIEALFQEHRHARREARLAERRRQRAADQGLAAAATAADPADVVAPAPEDATV